MPEKTVVLNIKNMDDEQFAKHWNLRHHSIDLPKDRTPFGLGKVDARPSIVSAFRAFHDTMHRLNPGRYDHEHNH